MSNSLETITVTEIQAMFYVLTELCIPLGDQRLATGRCGFPVFHYMNTEHPIKFTDIFGAVAKFDSKLRPTGVYAVAMM